MNRALFATCALTLATLCAPASAAPALKMWRLDCGTILGDAPGRELTASCYLIRHGATYLLWDAGYPAEYKGRVLDLKTGVDATVTRTIVEQLARIGIQPGDISMVGLSHYHLDHIGQARAFPGATLLMGKADLDALSATPPAQGLHPEALKNWITGPGKADPIEGDRDIFGDGSVVMLDLHGHTPGHHGLLVKLPGKGAILLTGDVAHFRENYDSNAVAPNNTNRADSIASIERFKDLARTMNATVIIQHDPRDIAKLPVFPEAAE